MSILTATSANAMVCEEQAVSKNLAYNGRKFHLRDPITNQYLIVEANTGILRTVENEEFEQAKFHEITWFTACNGFTQIFEDRYVKILV